uniref:Tetratricopeptide repeat protein n=1 Tax=candidate division WOR-3 bacterium TaxID=2052148 RepID=A0A7V3ZVT6_UNCW3
MNILIIFIIFLFIVAVYSLIINLIKKPALLPTLFTESLISYIANKKEEAIKKMEELVKMNSEFIDGYFYLIDWYQEKGETERAKKIAELLTLRRNLPKDKEAIIFKKLSTFLAKEGRYFRAISLLEEVIKSSVRDKETAVLLFTLYLKTENYSSAKEFLDKYGKNFFDNNELATYYAELGNQLLTKDKKEGKEYLEKSLKYDEKNLYGLLYLGNYYESQNNYERAIDYWLELLKNYPDELYLLKEKLANAFFSLGRYEELVKIYKNFGERTKKEDYYLEILEFYKKMENIKEAIDILENAKNSNPNIYLLLAKAYITLNDLKKANENLENYLKIFKKEKKFTCPHCGKELTRIMAVCLDCLQWNV